MVEEGLAHKIETLINVDGGGSQSLYLGNETVIPTDGRSIPSALGLKIKIKTIKGINIVHIGCAVMEKGKTVKTGENLSIHRTAVTKFIINHHRKGMDNATNLFLRHIVSK